MSSASNRDKHYDDMPMQYTANFNGACKDEFFLVTFLAHLSRRLVQIGESDWLSVQQKG